MDHELSDINQMQKGRLSIAYPIIRSSYMIPATLPAFHRQYPGVEVILYEEPSTVLEELLISGKADIAIFNHPIKNPHLDYEVLRRERNRFGGSQDPSSGAERALALRMPLPVDRSEAI